MDITIYDGNNWFRRRIETDLMGTAVSNCFREVQNKPCFPIIVWDGFGSLKARREIYPEYKENRKKAGESIYESQNFLKKILRLGKGVSVEVEGYEADDVIAALCNKYKAQGHSIFIESNDGDLAQLGVPMARTKAPTMARWVTLYKTTVGDPSDNVKGIKGFGKGAWEKLSEKELQTLEALVISYSKESKERVEEILDKITLTPKVKNWLLEKENRELLLKYNKVVNFLPVSAEQIAAGTIVNSNTPELAEPIFEEFMI